MDIFIVDPICINMMQRALVTTTHAMMMAIQEKRRSYTERTQGDDFIPLDIMTYGCLYSRFDSFLLITCA
jgi:hypothetical protein